MANLAIVGSHSTNGVAAIHSELLRTTTVKDLAEMFPDRFSSKTNGVTQRRWLMLANPGLSAVITDAIGNEWITNLDELARLKPLAVDADFQKEFRQAKREAKLKFTDWLRSTLNVTVNPDSIFDCQVKRIHEYKRQLLNARDGSSCSTIGCGTIPSSKWSRERSSLPAKQRRRIDSLS